MSTNIERAADLIADATVPPGTSIRWGMDRAVLAAKLLADAGLLAAVDEQDKTIQALSRLLAGAEEAATERAVQIGRVRNALSSIARVRADYEAYLLRYDDHAEWYVATADALEYALTLITEALEGETE